MKLEYTKEYLKADKELETTRKLAVEQLEEEGLSTVEAFYHWDDNLAPKTTNLKQLEGVGYTPNGCLEDLMNALTFINVTIVNKGGLEDKELYDYIVDKVLVEPVPQIPLYVGFTDYIVVNGDK